MEHSQSAAQNHLCGLFAEAWEVYFAQLEQTQRDFILARGFEPKAGQLMILPATKAAKGQLALLGLGSRADYSPALFRAVGPQLKTGSWHFELPEGLDHEAAYLAYGIGLYGFDRYKSAKNLEPAKWIDPHLDKSAQARTDWALEAHNLARDLVNMPANTMGPEALHQIVQDIALRHGAECKAIIGEALLEHNYPAIHAVGRAAATHRAPRFIEMSWEHPKADEKTPHVVLVGKGVVFDTGGLNLKAGAGMALMKKDMGGAAHALALGQWIMATKLKLRLTILLPIVENAVAGDAMRPGDVIATRAGLSVEVGNTDAEGRLILADALTRAAEISPTLTLDFATLTGAARVALGPDIVPFYTDNDAAGAALMQHAKTQYDPLWPMPLWAGYEAALDSDIADLKNDPSGWAQGGSVLAALFLKRFAPKTGQWIHFDLFAWNPRSRNGYPLGAEAQTLRACYQFLKGFA